MISVDVYMEIVYPILGKGLKLKTPTFLSRILMRRQESTLFNRLFNYKSLICEMNSLDRGSNSNTSYTLQQCVSFVSCPKKEYGQAIKCLGRYVLHTKDKVTILISQMYEDLESYTGAGFAGSYDKDNIPGYMHILYTVYSRYKYVQHTYHYVLHHNICMKYIQYILHVKYKKDKPYNIVKGQTVLISQLGLFSNFTGYGPNYTLM